MLGAAGRHLVAREGREPLAGDVLLFRVLRDGPAKHCGVCVGEGRFVHAYSGQAVTASWLTRWWSARLVGLYAFPTQERR